MDEFKSIRESLKRCRETALAENELWKFTEALISDLETCKNENAQLRNQLNELLNKDNSLSQLYLGVEEENSNMKNENKALKFKLNAQKLQFNSEKFEIEKGYELKIQNLEEELGKIRQKFSDKEAEFFEELQIAQATSAYEFEKIEKKLTWQLSEVNKRLYESDLINSKLREQLQNTQNENIRSSLSKNSGVSPLRNTNIMEYDLEPPNNSKPDTSKNTEEKSKNTPLRTYEPLQVECCNAAFEKTPEKQSPQLFKGKFSSRRSYTSRVRNISSVPPLMPCSNAKPKNKKRKLYDPDDLSYLVALNPEEND